MGGAPEPTPWTETRPECLYLTATPARTGSVLLRGTGRVQRWQPQPGAAAAPAGGRKKLFPTQCFSGRTPAASAGVKLFPLPRTYSFCSHDRRKLLRASAENSPPPGSLPRSPNRTHYPFLNISLQQTERNSSGRSSRQAGFLLSLFYLFIYFYFLCCSGFCYTLK